MKLAAIVLALGALGVRAAPAAAEPRAAIRVGAGVGWLEQTTWAAPEVDLVGTFDVGARGEVAVAAGYLSLDNHTFLADGRAVRIAVTGGARLSRCLRAAAGLDLAYVAYHADPDVLADHDDVDLLARRGGLMPGATVELARRIHRSTELGVFARVAFTELELFDAPSGARERARLVLGGVFLALAL